MNRSLSALLLLVCLWSTPARALDWWVAQREEADSVRTALEEVWPAGEVTVRVGEPPAEGDAAWDEGDTLVLRVGGYERRAQQVSNPSTRVVLVRSWIEASQAPLPPPPPPTAPAPSRLGGTVRSLHAPHLLPGAGGETGFELGVGAVGTGSLDTDPIEGAAEGYAPVFGVAAGLARLRFNATVWNLWEPERNHRPMVLGGCRCWWWLGSAGAWRRGWAARVGGSWPRRSTTTAR